MTRNGTPKAVHARYPHRHRALCNAYSATAFADTRADVTCRRCISIIDTPVDYREQLVTAVAHWADDIISNDDLLKALERYERSIND